MLSTLWINNVEESLGAYLDELEKSLSAIEDLSEALKFYALKCYVKNGFEFDVILNWVHFFFYR